MLTIHNNLTGEINHKIFAELLEGLSFGKPYHHAPSPKISVAAAESKCEDTIECSKWTSREDTRWAEKKRHNRKQREKNRRKTDEAGNDSRTGLS